jgi:hypothetical protein
MSRLLDEQMLLDYLDAHIEDYKGRISDALGGTHDGFLPTYIEHCKGMTYSLLELKKCVEKGEFATEVKDGAIRCRHLVERQASRLTIADPEVTHVCLARAEGLRGTDGCGYCQGYEPEGGKG